MPNYSLVVPFLTDDLMFARGVQFGQLYSRMRSDETVIQEYLSIWLQEQVTLTASRLGWRVAEMRRWGRDWFFCRLERPAVLEDTTDAE